MDLSIVIPAYEESQKIGRDVKAAADFLAGHNFTGEIIVVDDGSKDRTVQAAKSVETPSSVKLNVVRYKHHKGKGYAVRTGIGQTTGKYVIFADSGCCVPYEEALQGLELLQKGACDIAHGSRKLQGCRIEKSQGLYRRLCSKMFHWFVIRAMKIPAGLTDTQCGFKIYKGDVARHLYGKCVTDGFAFDIEIIVRACKECYRIKEFPITWTCDRDSRLSPTRSSWRIFSELVKIKKIAGK